MDKHNKKNPIVSIFLSLLISVVFYYYKSSKNIISRENNFTSTFYTNFIHVEPYHLFLNLYSLYYLSRIEQQIGSKQFFYLIVFSLLFNTLVELIIVHQLKIKIHYSVGFSGVLFGLLAWELITTRKLDMSVLLTIAILVVLPSLQNPKASLLGHSIGAASGIVSGFIWYKLWSR
jgi:membrane associated rhomboid family serine protease